MLTIGITGGTGSGKTTALSVLAEMGAECFDCDEIYRALLESSPQLKEELLAGFGDIGTDGGIDRKKLGAKVFNDPSALDELNRIAHKHVIDEVDRLMEQSAAQGRDIAVIDAIALIESGISERCDFTVFVHAPEEVRLRRIMRREGITEDYAMMRIRAQKPDEFFKSRCDYVLDGAADMDDFRRLCGEFFEEKIEEYRRK